MKVYGRITTFLTILLFPVTLHAQESVAPKLYSIAEGYWIRDSAVINLEHIGFNESSVLMIEAPVAANADTGFVVMDRHREEDDVMAVGKIVETDKVTYLYLLDERDSQGKVKRIPDPANVIAYEWSFRGFGNNDSAENAIILIEYLEGSMEARGERWYLFMIHFRDRKNESAQLYGH